MKSTLALFATALTLLAVSAKAAEYQVTVNTSSLAGVPNGPYYLDFQLNYGSGPFGNSAAIGDFTFGGGTAAGTPSLSGTAAGDLASVVTLSDNSANPFNEFYQHFTPGTTVTFDVTLSNNTTINTPDGFNFGILDSTADYLPDIPTTLTGDQLVQFAIGGDGLVNQQIYTSTGSGTGVYSGVTVSVQAVPEPTSWALAATCAGAFACLRRRSRLN